MAWSLRILEGRLRYLTKFRAINHKQGQVKCLSLLNLLANIQSLFKLLGICMRYHAFVMLFGHQSNKCIASSARTTHWANHFPVSAISAFCSPGSVLVSWAMLRSVASSVIVWQSRGLSGRQTVYNNRISTGYILKITRIQSWIILNTIGTAPFLVVNNLPPASNKHILAPRSSDRPMNQPLYSLRW